jgi:hypothetical protein
MQVKKMDLREHMVFWAGKLTYVLTLLIAPMLYAQHSLGQTALLWLVCELTTGYMLAFLFQVSYSGCSSCLCIRLDCSIDSTIVSAGCARGRGHRLLRAGQAWQGGKDVG